jgi:hypothetical protein
MASESGILSGDANDAVVNAVRDRLAHPFDLVVEPTQPAGQPIGGSELPLARVDFFDADGTLSPADAPPIAR